ncbi:MAG: hypothetical protein AB1644_12450 [Candidatus Zixiibacteriota bacterium]
MTRRIGIDFVENGMRVATVDTDDTGQTTAKIELFNAAYEQKPDLVERDAVTVGVPDNLCQVKPLRLSAPTESDLRLRVEFELAQTQLEPPETFLYDFISTARDDRLLGMVYRRASLAEWQNARPLPNPLSSGSIRYRSRATALGLGYLQYCRPFAGDLICLADFGRSVTPVCFVYGRQVVDLARQVTVPGKQTDEIALRRQAMDLKTIVNFRLMGLADAGITVPLSQLVVVGVSDALHSLLAEYFPIGVSCPELLPSVTVNGEVQTEAAGLVALGLTVY